ncbi:hypothetical protein ACPCVO_36040 [Streptomyces umbrinus]|uniref:hypothetical protein n=1 Tax=Streptomyces umbrinus TaxID=67370 RepID=UPI003C2EE91D
MTNENPHRVAAAVVALHNLGSPVPEATTRSLASWWSQRVLPARGGEAAARIQNLRLGIQAFAPYLSADATTKAAVAAVRALTDGKADLPDVENAAHLADEISRQDAGSRDAKVGIAGIKVAVTAFLATGSDGCEGSDPKDSLPRYVAARGLSALGYSCVVSKATSEEVSRQMVRLASSKAAWSVPDAVLLLQVVKAAHGDKNQSGKATSKVDARSRQILWEALKTKGPYYREIGVTLTEFSVASSELVSPPGKSPEEISSKAKQALRNIVLLQGRIPDQPTENSLIDGYLTALVHARLTGSAIKLKQPRTPAPDASLRDHVRFFLAASLRTDNPLSQEEVTAQAMAAIRRADNPVDRLTLATSATLAASRSSAPCAVIDKDDSLLDEVAPRVAAQSAQGSDTVKAWLALLWGITARCSGSQKNAASQAAALERQVAAKPPTGNPTARAVQAWFVAELSCLVKGKVQARPVHLKDVAVANNAGEGIGLGAFAALRTQEIKAAHCAAWLENKVEVRK